MTETSITIDAYYYLEKNDEKMSEKNFSDCPPPTSSKYCGTMSTLSSVWTRLFISFFFREKNAMLFSNLEQHVKGTFDYLTELLFTKN